MSPDAETAVPAPQYARFSRRFRGILIDWIIAMAAIFGAVMLASTVGRDGFSRALGIAVIVALLLYEPVLVFWTGGTLGHYFTNLRVVDDRGGNVSFLKACARMIVKGVLGWYSFVVLAATRRNQAIHDLVTRSTVQIRDPAKALAGQYIIERNEIAAAGMPSRPRRVVVLCVYLALGFAVYLAAMLGLSSTGILSSACIDRDFCSAADRAIDLVAAGTFLMALALVVTLGWKGQLPGARRAP